MQSFISDRLSPRLRAFTQHSFARLRILKHRAAGKLSRICSNCYSGEIAERVPVNIAGADDQGGGDGAQRGATVHRCRLTAADHFLGTRHAAHRHDQSTIHGSGHR